eukprot:scaffold9.g3272.t1
MGTQEIKGAIERLLNKIQELEGMVSNFQGDNELLHRRINEYVEELGKLYAARSSLVPVELLASMDDGGNPDTWTQDLFRSAILHNQGSKGRVQAVRALRDGLAQRLLQQAAEQQRAGTS